METQQIKTRIDEALADITSAIEAYEPSDELAESELQGSIGILTQAIHDYANHTGD